jgi:Flp pilus assembly protein TadD
MSDVLEAEKDYKKALEKEPNRTSAELFLFNLYIQSSRLDEAMKILDEQAKKNPSDNAIYAMKGTLYERQGKIEDAKQNYLRALQADPNIDLAANNLAFLIAEQGGDLTTALGYAQGAQKRHPEDPNIADTVGWVYYKLGRPKLAKDSAEFAASKQPDNPEFQYHLGMIYKANDQRSVAEAALKKAVSSPREFKQRDAAQDAIKDIEHWRHLVP